MGEGRVNGGASVGLGHPRRSCRSLFAGPNRDVFVLCAYSCLSLHPAARLTVADNHTAVRGLGSEPMLLTEGARFVSGRCGRIVGRSSGTTLAAIRRTPRAACSTLVSGAHERPRGKSDMTFFEEDATRKMLAMRGVVAASTGSPVCTLRWGSPRSVRRAPGRPLGAARLLTPVKSDVVRLYLVAADGDAAQAMDVFQ